MINNTIIIIIMIINVIGSGQIAIISMQLPQISSPALILLLADGTQTQVPLLSCSTSSAVLSDVFIFPVGAVNYQLTGTDPNGVVFEHTIEETATFPGSTCP